MGARVPWIDLVGVVLAELDGGAEGFALDLDVLAEGDEVVVEPLGAVDGVEDLLLEEEAGDLAVEVGDAEIAEVDGAAAATKQGLGEGDGRGGGGEGVELGAGAVDDLRIVVDGGGDLGAGTEALKVGDVGGDKVSGAVSVGRSRWSRRCPRCRCVLPVRVTVLERRRVAGGEDELGVEERDVGLGVGDEAGGVLGEVGDGGRGRVEGREIGDGGGGGIGRVGGVVEERGAGAADAVGTLVDGVVDAAQGATALGAAGVGVGEGEVEARDFDVGVVLEGKGDGVVRGEVELAVANEGRETCAGAGEELRDAGRAIGTDETEEARSRDPAGRCGWRTGVAGGETAGLGCGASGAGER